MEYNMEYDQINFFINNYELEYIGIDNYKLEYIN